MNAQGRYEMKTCGALIKRNVKMYFKDKGMFFTSLITPMILLVLYVTFLYNVYEDSFRAGLPPMVAIDESLLQGLVGGLLLSSLLAVSTVTVPFCANMIMVQDHVTGARSDFSVSPTKTVSVALSYYVATVINGLIISFVALLLGFAYLAVIGWYLSFTDVLLMTLDVVLLVSFGTALSSLICHPLRTQGAISAVGTIVSTGYGFICGAYMPISNFSEGLRNVMGFLPSTYGTSLVRNHALQGVFAEMSAQGMPDVVIQELRDVGDCNLYCLGNSIETWVMYAVLIGTVCLLVGAYVLLVTLSERKNRK